MYGLESLSRGSTFVSSGFYRPHVRYRLGRYSVITILEDGSVSLQPSKDERWPDGYVIAMGSSREALYGVQTPSAPRISGRCFDNEI